MGWVIRRAGADDRESVAELRALLWPEGSCEEHMLEFDAQLATGRNGTLPAATFVCEQANGLLAGFIDVGLRSHAEGCDPAHTVGYIEGWFVRHEWRGQKIGRELIRAAEEWARSQGCMEMASDAQMDNNVSIEAHQALGFEIVERSVQFRKGLK